MDNIEVRAQGSKNLCSKCDRCMQRILDKVKRFGFETQYQALLNLGYQDERLILRALKRNKGDVTLAEEFINTSPPKKERKERHQRKGSQERQKFDKEEKRKFRKERSPSKRKDKLEKMEQEMPDFEQLNEQLCKLGFDDAKENFKALKKNERDPQKAADHLKLKQSLKDIQLCQSFSKGQLDKIFVDCNNCFFIERNFIKLSVKGEYKQVEQKIAKIMKLFQTSYESKIEIVLVFDNSSMMKDEALIQQFSDNYFKLFNSKPQFKNADDALVHLASLESTEAQSKIMFVTSDQMLQARLMEKNAQNIMSSKRFFSFIRDNFIGSNAYQAVVDQ